MSTDGKWLDRQVMLVGQSIGKEIRLRSTRDREVRIERLSKRRWHVTYLRDISKVSGEPVWEVVARDTESVSRQRANTVAAYFLGHAMGLADYTPIL